VLRTFLAETVGLPEGSVHVIQPDVGGAFGLKQPLYQEQPVVAWASMLLERPVKWIEERSESFLVGGHARDTRFRYEAAYRRDGTVTALRVDVLADIGAPTALLGWTMSFVSAYCLPGTYAIDALSVDLRAVVTNKCPWSPYRGFGKDAASFLMDRIMDDVARHAGLDRAVVRRRNFIPPEAFPYSRPGSAILDSGDYPAVLDRVLKMIDYEGFPALQAAARAEGRRIGIGIGQELTPEGVAIPGSLMNQAYDGATVRIAPTGDVTVLVGVTTPGTGNEMALAQIAADTLGFPIESIRVVQGDTELCPYGLGNFSSRSVMYGGSAVRLAALDLRAKLFRVAGRMLEASEDELEAVAGQVYVTGSPSRGIPMTRVVSEIYRHTFGRNADDVEPGLESTRYFRSSNIYHQPEKQGRFSTYPTWPNGAAACIVEVDPETGIVRILRHCLVEDAGTIINPLLADANLHGGITQGIGSAMFENLVYDDGGQLQTATLMDYTIPTSVELPRYEIEHHTTPSPFTPLGVKGVGESGMGSVIGALCSAIENAFPELDLVLTDLPLSPKTVWQAIKDAPAAAARTQPVHAPDAVAAQ
jgi:carbon-monoxide dehydrogenase large subunit